MKTAKKATKKKVARKPKAEVASPVTSPVTSPVEEKTTPEVLVKASPQEVRVIGLANNPRYVYASLEGQKIAVEVPAWMSQNLIKKTIKAVKKIDSEHYEIVRDGN